jgi:hypothetical protein
MSMRLSRLIFIALIITGTSCGDQSDELDIFSMTYDFRDGAGDWVADFTDYSFPETPQADSVYRWTYYYGDSIKTPNGGKAILLSCNNVNGDIFMFLKTKVTGLRANSNYNLVYDISVATNANAGEGIILKAGGSDLEPKKIVENNYCTLNVDKGANLNSGESLISLGDVGKTELAASYTYLDKNNKNAYSPLIVKSNSKGEIWLIVGTDSLLEGPNVVIYSKVNVVFSVTN